MNSILFDTNLLVYAWDASDRAKQRRAVELFEHERRRIILASQNLSELAAVLLRKELPSAEISAIIDLYAKLAPVWPVEPSDIIEALRAVTRYRMSYWDAQIWAVAKRCGRAAIFTEDGPIGQTIEGVAYVNPFAQPFG